MQFNRNSSLVNNICLVQIKSVDAVVSIPSLTTMYHTPSKITYTQNSKAGDDGVLIKKKLSLYYPGLSDTDFEKFNSLCRGAYQVYVKTDKNEVYELASDYFFMTCSTSFNMQTGWQVNFEHDSSIPVKYRGIQELDGITTDGFDYDFDFYLS